MSDLPLPAGESAAVTIQYVLVGFSPQDPPDPKSPRTRAEAEARARRVFEKARSGEDFDRLVREFTDDRRRPPPAVHRRIEELYRKAKKRDHVGSLDDNPDEMRIEIEIAKLEIKIEDLLTHGKDFDSIRAADEYRRAHTIITQEFRDQMNRRFPGFRDFLDSPFPPSLTDVVWLTRDRGVLDALLRDFDASEIADTFTLINHGAEPALPDQIPRSKAMTSWANVAFRLNPGDIGFVVPDPDAIPAFAIFKRIREDES